MNHAKALFNMLVVSLVMVCGCAQVPKTTASMDAEGKLFNVPPGKANIYVIRTGTVGFAAAMRTFLDGKSQGRLASGNYHVLVVEPGTHTVSAAFENQNPAELKFTVDAGENHYLTATMKAGLIASTGKLAKVGEAKGKTLVLESKRAELQPE